MLFRSRVFGVFSTIFDQRTFAHPLITFILLFLFAVEIARRTCYRDPTSAFFQLEKAREPIYSTVRRDQGRRFVQQAILHPQRRGDATATPEVCVGIASVTRKSSRYFKDAVGSLLDGLDPTERARIHLILFIAQSNQSSHPAYSEGWMKNVADTILSYDLTEDKMQEVKEWEIAAGEFRQKMLFDYAYLLQACHNVNSSYTIMLEDDVLALDGWFHRTEGALRTAEALTKEKGEEEDFLYLRLFYTDIFLGWNSEEWATYLAASILLTATELIVLLIIRSWIPSLKISITNKAIFVSCFICTPLCIGLFFAAGRSTMLPLSPGVHEMPKYGCCSQGLVFPRERVRDVVGMLQAAGSGYVDMLIEAYANERHETRWAIVPSVLQHVGAKSTKSNGDVSPPSKHSVAETIWNYDFELNNAERLRQEHVKAIDFPRNKSA